MIVVVFVFLVREFSSRFSDRSESQHTLSLREKRGRGLRVGGERVGRVG